MTYIVRADKVDTAIKALVGTYRRHKQCWQHTYSLGLAYKHTGERIKAKIKFKQALLHCSDPKGQARIREALAAVSRARG